MTNQKRALSPSRQKLIELLQEIHFGRIQDLAVRDGEPVLSPLPRIIRDIVFGKDNGSHRSLGATDFVLKDQHLELFEYFDRELTMKIDTLVVQYGLPLRMTVAKAA